MMLKRIEINVYTTFISFLVLVKVLNINLSSKKIQNVCRSYNCISYTLVIVSEVTKFLFETKFYKTFRNHILIPSEFAASTHLYKMS